MSGRDIDLSYDRLHGVEDEEKPEKSKLSPTNCPRCDAQNEPKASFCQNCGQALTREAFEKVEEEEEKTLSKFAELRDEDVMSMLETISKMHKLAKQDPEIREKLEKIE
ncbi:hypothetical protein AKJ56_01320 [candidate division MSBL1 archaeon SCGC-AAA382N08]|uniref:Zinc-ribbon domain-containing protein n=1 Tax=candidate division MSBL1 archaeon SCGC-AAA382N08 TaxID=1698285 RepID=A0A133VPT9_9EURY|nr:hypothetical protein AKJ56_01320 [candidate division MSBL1 archaeon SCGC-AAA382N08]